MKHRKKLSLRTKFLRDYSILTLCLCPSLGRSEGLAGAITQGFIQRQVSSRGLPAASPQTNFQGRASKAGQGASIAGTGAGESQAMGDLLTSAAMPLISSLDPIQVAAGETLLAQAGQSYQQRQADSNVAQFNQAQTNMLRGNGQDGLQNIPSQATAQMTSALTPMVSQALASKLESNGQDPLTFIGSLPNLKTPQQVANALGEPSPSLSPEEAAQAQALAQSKVQSAIASLGANASNTTSQSSLSGAEMGGFSTVLQGNPNSSEDSPDTEKRQASPLDSPGYVWPLARKTGSNSGDDTLARSPASDPSLTQLKDLFQRVNRVYQKELNRNKGLVAESKDPNLSTQMLYLKNHGILPPRLSAASKLLAQGDIFHTARVVYHRFQLYVEQ